MSEAKFQEKVIYWCRNVVDNYKRKSSVCSADRLSVESRKLITAWQPWSSNIGSSDWKWLPYSRQIDVVIGINVEIDGVKNLLPLVVIELKSGARLNSDELDKKSAIYGALREIYPWIHTVFLHEDMAERNLGEAYTLRNGRQFDTIFTEWSDHSMKLLEAQIEWQLQYMLEYWGF